MFSKFFTFSLSAFIALIFTAMSFGQAVIFEDDFDSYTAGLQLACQNPVDWTTWSLTPCGPDDGMVSSAQSSSSPNSVNITLDIDQLKLFPVKYTTGKYSMSFEMYIANGLTGYFNCLASWNAGAPVWAMQVMFNIGGLGNLDAGGITQGTPFTYPYDTWMDVEVIADLDLDVIEIWLDDVMIFTGQWSLGTGISVGELALEANNFYGGGTDGVPDYYFDNYSVVDENAPPPTTNFSDDMEAYTAGQQLACQNPVDWDTWSNLPCDPTEDAYVSNLYSYSGSNSTVIVQNNDLIRHHGQLTSGRWYISFMMYIPTGASGYFNSMSGFTPNPFQWAHEVVFGVGGAGELFADVTVPFTWVEDAWQLVQVVVDLTADVGEFWIGGVMIHSWQWTRGGTINLELDVTDLFGGEATDEMYFDDFWFGDVPVPVELTSFAANVNNNGDVILNWTTATEINNQMFEIERRSEEGQFLMIGYVNGHGTTTESQEYSYIDNNVETGTYFYRLKQIDYLGTYEYSDAVEVEVKGPLTFGLEQNYPNPFNPSTNIKYNIPESGIVKLAIYNTLGEEVAVLVDGMVQPGFYEVTFDASSLPSGAYFYRLQSDNLNQVKKMLLMK